MARPVLTALPSASKPGIGSQLITGHPLARQLLGAWILNEGAGNTVYDAVKGPLQSGVLTNGPVWDRGQYGPAVKMDGTNDYILVPHHSDYDSLSQITLMTKTRHASAPVNFDTFIGKDPDGIWSSGFGMGVYTTPPLNLFFYFGNYGNGNHRITVACPYDPLQWFTMAATCIVGSNLSVYCNGTNLISSNGIFGSAANNTAGIQLGRLGSDSYNLPGYMEYAYVWGRALKPSEIQQITIDPYVMFREPGVSIFLLPKIIIAPTNLSANAASGAWTAKAATIVPVRIAVSAAAVGTWQAQTANRIATRTLVSSPALASWAAPASTIRSGKVLSASGAALASWAALPTTLAPGRSTLAPGAAQATFSSGPAQLKSVIAANAAIATWQAMPATVAVAGISLVSGVAVATWVVPTGMLRTPVLTDSFLPTRFDMEDYLFWAELDRTK